MIHAFTRATSTRERYKIIQLSEKSTPRLVKIGYKQKNNHQIYHKQSRPHRQYTPYPDQTSFP